MVISFLWRSLSGTKSGLHSHRQSCPAKGHHRRRQPLVEELEDRQLMTVDLDNTFGTKGLVRTKFDDPSSATRIVLQDDGKFIVAGGIGTPSPDLTVGKLSVTRYNHDGSIDRNFGNRGTTTVFKGVPAAAALALQEDGKILVGTESSRGFTIVRLRSNGKLDKTFSKDGKVVIPFAGAKMSDIEVLGNGKILIVGDADSAQGRKVVATRLTRQGDLDKKFGQNGRSATRIATDDDVTAMQATSSGGYFVTGSTLAASHTSADDTDLFVAKYKANGKLDTSFGIQGKVITSLSQEPEFGGDLDVLSDGSVVIVGTTMANSVQDIAFVGYTPTGELDPDFGTQGITIASHSGNQRAYRMQVQGTGRLLVAGTTDELSAVDVTLVRVLSDGTLDPDLGTDGHFPYKLNGAEVAPDLVLVDPNRFVVATTSQNRYLLIGYYETIHIIYSQPRQAGSVTSAENAANGTAAWSLPDNASYEENVDAWLASEESDSSGE